MFVRYVVAQFEFVKGDHFLHPLFPCGRTVRVNVHSFWHFGISFTGHQPSARKISKQTRSRDCILNQLIKIALTDYRADINRCNLHLGKKEPSQKCNNVLVRLPVVKLVAKVVG